MDTLAQAIGCSTCSTLLHSARSFHSPVCSIEYSGASHWTALFVPNPMHEKSYARLSRSIRSRDREHRLSRLIIHTPLVPIGSPTVSSCHDMTASLTSRCTLRPQSRRCLVFRQSIHTRGKQLGRPQIRYIRVPVKCGIRSATTLSQTIEHA